VRLGPSVPGDYGNFGTSLSTWAGGPDRRCGRRHSFARLRSAAPVAVSRCRRCHPSPCEDLALKPMRTDSRIPAHL
jgi:hypothetical protein